MSSKLGVGVLLCVSWCSISEPACAQTTGFPDDFGHIGPSNAEVVLIAIGAAAVIGVAVYLIIPKQSTIEGCIESGDGGLQITSPKAVYILALDGFRLHAGQRVTVKGRRSKQKSGIRKFEVRKLVKDEGACGEPSQALIPDAAFQTFTH